MMGWSGVADGRGLIHSHFLKSCNKLVLGNCQKFTKVCPTKRKVKIVRVSSGIAMDSFV